MKKRKKNIVYSTNPNFKYDDEEELENTIAKNKQNLKIHLNRHKADKFSVVIKNFIGTKDKMKKIEKNIKTKLGVGGSIKNNHIIIQGKVREKVIEILNSEGYKTTSVGG
tara:strand:+ start:55083 stop:55412 length:330 start_codon:yes stop_codon:yes gene_type:complete